MAATVLLPLLVSAASNHVQSEGSEDNHTDTDSLERRKEEGGKVTEWRRRNDEQLWRWMEEGPMAGVESGQQWKTVLEEWKEAPTEDHKKWEETAWQLVRNWTEDDSLSSLLDLEDQDQVPMIHITSRVTVNNKTEEKTAMIPASSMEPFLHHMAPYAPILLLGLGVPILLLVSSLLFPSLILLIAVPLIVMVFLMFGGMLLAGTALVPFGIMGMGLMEHVVPWVAGQDVQAVIEKTGLEDLESLTSSLTNTTTLAPLIITTTLAPLITTTTLTQLLGDNSVVLTEIPRMLRW